MSDIFGDTTRAELQQEIDRLRADLAQRTAERDEARKEVCNLSGGFDVKQSRRVADARGWDCFKEQA
jgi:cell division protein FtsL